MGRRQAQSVLAAGLAGRPHVGWPEVLSRCPAGLFVVFGADVVALRGFSELVLTEPGAWFEPWARSRLSTGPGRPWVLHLGPIGPVPKLGGLAAM